jgi:hypothetical protein
MFGPGDDVNRPPHNTGQKYQCSPGISVQTTLSGISKYPVNQKQIKNNKADIK